MNGFIIVDKPTNILSHDLTAKIGRLFNTRAGHSGTLDPNVGGLMLIGLGRYTRLLRFFTRLDKTYVCLAKFKDNVKDEDINKLISKIGKNAQIPPAQSAVAKKLRYRTLYEVEILEIYGNRLLFKARVESGFYMRVLCKQINAEMEDLRRIAIGDIKEELAVNVYKLFYNPNSVKIYNIEELFPYLKIPRKDIDYNTYLKVIHGVKINIKSEDYIGLFYKNKFTAILNKNGNYEVVLA